MCSAVTAPAATASARALPSTIADFLNLQTGPVAIAHRGMGANPGADPTRPIENTLAAVRQGYESGASVVEVDLQMTADGEIVAWHDDFLADGTCSVRDGLADDQLRSAAARASRADGGGTAAQLVQQTQALGLRVMAGDVFTASDWLFGASLGVHALHANDVPLAVSLQPELH